MPFTCVLISVVISLWYNNYKILWVYKIYFGVFFDHIFLVWASPAWVSKGD